VNVGAANTFSGDTVISTGAKLTLGNNFALQHGALNVRSAGGNFALAAGTNGGRITGESAASSPTFGGLSGSRNLLAVFTNSVGNNETNLAAAAVSFDLTGTLDHPVYVLAIASNSGDDPSVISLGGDLTAWPDAVPGPDIIIAPADDFHGAGIDRVEVKIRRTFAANGRLFARLKVVVTSN
jgi:hypothetical protein